MPADQSTGDPFDSVPCGILATTGDDVITRVNVVFLEWTGYAQHELIGRSFRSLLDEGSQASWDSVTAASRSAHAEIRELSFTLLTAQGSELPILVNVAADDNGARLAVFDSTGRRDYERLVLEAKNQAEVSEASLRVLQDASTRFLAARSEEELGAAVSLSAREAFGALEVGVVGYADDGVSYRIVVGQHLRELMAAVRASRPTGSGALGAQEVFTITDLADADSRSDEVGRLFREHGIEAFCAVPIAAGEEVLGAFVCIFADARSFQPASIDLQLALARQAGLLLSRVRLETQLERLALHDQLTGLANRNLLDDRMSHSLAVAERAQQPMALIFVDLDGFKQVNDDLGHRVGDNVLQVVATRMKGAVRSMDIVGRFGGDEFLVVCEGADEDAAALVADRIAAEVREQIFGLPSGVGVTASIGIAVYTPGVSPVQTPDSLVLLADAAMYEAKRSGADRTIVKRA